MIVMEKPALTWPASTPRSAREPAAEPALPTAPGDWEKEQRKQWLRNEIARLRLEIDNLTQRRYAIDQQIYGLQNEIYTLRTEQADLNYKISGLQDRLTYLTNQRYDAKRNKRYASTPEERAYWQSVIDRLNDEIWRVDADLYNKRWRLNDVNNQIHWKGREVEQLNYEKGSIDHTLYYRRQEHAAYVEELRQLENSLAQARICASV